MKARRVRTKQGGFIVVVVLCMVMMLSVLLLGFHHEARASLHCADDFHKSEQALHCAIAGLQIAIAALQDVPDDHENRLWLSLLSGENTFAVDEGKCSVTVSQETGKFNVNLLKDKDGKLNRIRIDQVLRLFDLLNQQSDTRHGISYGIVPSIIDWIDSDEEITYLPLVRNEARGAESGYYSRLSPPYSCKNDLLEATEELLLVKGITPDTFDRISDYITVYGDGKININSAPTLILQSLSEEMDPALAQMIVDRRELKPFASVAELKKLPGMTDGIYHRIGQSATVQPASDHFQITSQGSVGRLRRTVIAMASRNAATKSIDLVLYKEL